MLTNRESGNGEWPIPKSACSVQNEIIKILGVDGLDAGGAVAAEAARGYGSGVERGSFACAQDKFRSDPKTGAASRRPYENDAARPA